MTQALATPQRTPEPDADPRADHRARSAEESAEASTREATIAFPHTNVPVARFFQNSLQALADARKLQELAASGDKEAFEKLDAEMRRRQGYGPRSTGRPLKLDDPTPDASPASPSILPETEGAAAAPKEEPGIVRKTADKFLGGDGQSFADKVLEHTFQHHARITSDDVGEAAKEVGAKVGQVADKVAGLVGFDSANILKALDENIVRVPEGPNFHRDYADLMAARAVDQIEMLVAGLEQSNPFLSPGLLPVDMQRLATVMTMLRISDESEWQQQLPEYQQLVETMKKMPASLFGEMGFKTETGAIGMDDRLLARELGVVGFLDPLLRQPDPFRGETHDDLNFLMVSAYYNVFKEMLGIRTEYRSAIAAATSPEEVSAATTAFWDNFNTYRNGLDLDRLATVSVARGLISGMDGAVLPNSPEAATALQLWAELERRQAPEGALVSQSAIRSVTNDFSSVFEQRLLDGVNESEKARLRELWSTNRAEQLLGAPLQEASEASLQQALDKVAQGQDVLFIDEVRGFYTQLSSQLKPYDLLARSLSSLEAGAQHQHVADNLVGSVTLRPAKEGLAEVVEGKPFQQAVQAFDKVFAEIEAVAVDELKVGPNNILSYLTHYKALNAGDEFLAENAQNAVNSFARLYSSLVPQLKLLLAAGAPAGSPAPEAPAAQDGN
ncbi:MAG: hypothetical protein KDD69_00470 [Bdellovibrionales bacterium]|nr:hypothetical protein [Bdellovibrionales bacterium]